MNTHTNPVGKRMFKVSKITLEQRTSDSYSKVIFMTLDRLLLEGNQYNVIPDGRCTKVPSRQKPVQSQQLLLTLRRLLPAGLFLRWNQDTLEIPN